MLCKPAFVCRKKEINYLILSYLKLLIVVYITGCSAGEQYSQRLFSRVLLGAQVGGMRGRQQSVRCLNVCGTFVERLLLYCFDITRYDTYV
jgi:hypothetical protein